MATTTAPTSEVEISEFLRACAARQAPVEVRGGGTRGGLGRPSQAENVLTLTNHTGVTLYQPGGLTLLAKAGTPLRDVEATLAAEGQLLPFEPMDHRGLYGTSGEPTIGAVVACNISGPRRIQAGACRDSMIGVRFVDGSGEIVKNGGRVMKNVTGYDLVRLMCGAHGTLGVLTEVAFKVLPASERAATLLIHGLSDETAIEVLTGALGSPFEVSGAAHLPGDAASSVTALRVEGLSGQVGTRIEKLRALHGHGRDCSLIEGDDHLALWQQVRDVARFHGTDGAVWRLSIKPTDGPAAGSELRRTCDADVFYDWGGGLVWALVPQAGQASAAAVRAVVARCGGHATLVRASEAVRREVEIFQPRPARLRAIDQTLKASFDPAGILNPGRISA